MQITKEIYASNRKRDLFMMSLDLISGWWKQIFRAALGLHNSKDLMSLLKERNTGKLYNDHFRGFLSSEFPLEKTDYAENIYWVYGILLNRKKHEECWIYLMKLLSQNNIGTRPFFILCTCSLYWEIWDCLKWKLSRFENLAEYGFYIPMVLLLTEDQINKTAEVIKIGFLTQMNYLKT